MPKRTVNYYSIYRVSDDMPLYIHHTAKECAAYMGIGLTSFYARISRQLNKKTREPRVLAVYQDED